MRSQEFPELCSTTLVKQPDPLPELEESKRLKKPESYRNRALRVHNTAAAEGREENHELPGVEKLRKIADGV